MNQIMNDVVIPKDFRENVEIPTTKKDRFLANIEAIETSLKIKNENRNATIEEQRILAKFSSWGGLSSIFTNNDFKDKNDKLKELFKETTKTQKDADKLYSDAFISSSTSYFTSNEIIEPIYNALDKMGFNDKDGIRKKVLEPSMGVGNFVNNCPFETFNFSGVELDENSFLISSQLQPNMNILNSSYQNFLKHDFDLIIGNPPYDNRILARDNISQDNRQKIANYFFTIFIKFIYHI